jgi:hypothetical protein
MILPHAALRAGVYGLSTGNGDLAAQIKGRAARSPVMKLSEDCCAAFTEQ